MLKIIKDVCIRKLNAESTVLFAIVMLAAILRMYKIDEFAIFLSDQAIDSFAVKNILAGDFTLLGPRASVGQFFNGPAIYYLMLPFFYLFRLDPLAGTYFQIFLQLITIPLLYHLGKRIGSKITGIMAALLFAVSPLFIYYSKAAFNSYPALFFSTLILYLLTFDKKKTWQFLFAGFVTGILVQAHYLLYIYAFFYFVSLSIQRNWKNIMNYLTGAIIGISPFLLFELRHNFFNVNAIFRHMANGGGEKIEFADRLVQFLTSLSQILGYKDIVIGAMILLAVLFASFTYIKKQNTQSDIITWIFVALIISMIIYKGPIQSHYLIGIQPIIILMLASFIITLRFEKIYIYILSLVVVFSALYSLYINFGIPKEQDSLGLMHQRKIVTIIKNDLASSSKTNGNPYKWNITQDLQQDNRAMPIRYLLEISNLIPMSFDNYSDNTVLYLVSKKNKKLSDIKTWEFMSFGKNYEVSSTIDISQEIILYKLNKLSTTF